MPEERRKGERRRKVSRDGATQIQSDSSETKSRVQIDGENVVANASSTPPVQRFTAGDLEVSISTREEEGHGEVH